MSRGSYPEYGAPVGVGGPQFSGGRFGVGNFPSVSSARYSHFAIPHPDKVGTGCCLFLGMSYDNGSTISTISDNLNGSWSTTPVRSIVGASSTLALFRFPNTIAADPTSGAGLIVTVVFSATLNTPVTWLFAFSGIATSSPEDGGSTAASQAPSGGVVSAGSFTPGSAGSHVIVGLFCLDGNSAAGAPSAVAPSTNFTLMTASSNNINQGAGIPKAGTFWVQPSQAAVNAGVTLTANAAGDTWNCLAEAFKAQSGAGVAPSGTRVNAYSFQYVATATATAITSPVPLTQSGSFPVMATVNGQFTSVTDSQGNTWNFEMADAAAGSDISGQIWYPTIGTLTAPDLAFKVTGHNASPIAQFHAAFFEFIGMSGSIGANAWNTGTSLNHNPDITPTQTGAIVVLSAPDGLGPVTAISNVTTAVLDSMGLSPSAGAADDGNTENSGDGWGHFYVTSGMVGVSQNVTWTAPNGNPACHAAEFKHS